LAKSVGERVVPFALLSMAVLALAAPGIPEGAAKVEVEVAGCPLTVYTYKPPGYRGGPLVLVFHGLARNAEDYCDFARGLAERTGAVVAAPEFDEDRFPYQKYTRGAVRRPDGSIAPRDEWTWSIVPRLADALRRREGRPELPFYLIGHSAGAQFVARLTGFVETGACGHVAANPGAYLLPTRDEPFPYGFGGLPDDLADESALRRYLGRRLVVYLGTADDQRDADLDTSTEADRQGHDRLDRGRRVFQTARDLARRRGWDFRWRLVEAKDVGHNARAMFNNPACEAALFGTERADYSQTPRKNAP
jgi:poly(3-hydroxybutyrate) depolymerase